MLQEANFPVIEVPAVGIPEDWKEIDSTGYKFIVRDDTGEVISCVTDSYKLIRNQENFEYLEELKRKLWRKNLGIMPKWRTTWTRQ